jgi:uncharacterized protein (DUF362 family)
MIKNAFDLLGGLDFIVSSQDSVLIKPNLCTLKKSDTGATTDPKLVEALIDLLHDKTSNISIVESDSGAIDAEVKFAACGYIQLSQRTNVNLINLSKEKLVDVTIPNALALKSIKLPRMVMDSDVLINVPKLKASEITGVTLSLKNAFGLIPSRFKTKYHRILDKVIVDLNKVVKPRLALVDGIVGMEGQGPIDGNPIKMNLTVAGLDCVAVDCVSASIMGFNPESVSHIKLANSEGVGEGKLQNISIKGKSISEVQRKFKMPHSIPLTRRIKFKITEWDTLLTSPLINECIGILRYYRRWKHGLT